MLLFVGLIALILFYVLEWYCFTKHSTFTIIVQIICAIITITIILYLSIEGD